MSWCDHLSDEECREALEAIGDAMEGEEFDLVHPSGESEEANIQERVGIVLRQRDEARAALAELEDTAISTPPDRGPTLLEAATRFWAGGSAAIPDPGTFDEAIATARKELKEAARETAGPRVEDLTQEEYEHMRMLIGWLGMLCDEVIGAGCFPTRAPTSTEADRTLQAVRRMRRRLQDLEVLAASSDPCQRAAGTGTDTPTSIPDESGPPSGDSK